MLKKNLITIAIVIVSLVMVSNAFGQEMMPSPKRVKVKTVRKIGTASKTNSRIQAPQPKGLNKEELKDLMAARSKRINTKSKRIKRNR